MLNNIVPFPKRQKINPELAEFITCYAHVFSHKKEKLEECKSNLEQVKLIVKNLSNKEAKFLALESMLKEVTVSQKERGEAIAMFKKAECDCPKLFRETKVIAEQLVTARTNTKRCRKKIHASLKKITLNYNFFRQEKNELLTELEEMQEVERFILTGHNRLDLMGKNNR